jgi:molybdopterin converting factor small subunit
MRKIKEEEKEEIIEIVETVKLTQDDFDILLEKGDKIIVIPKEKN